MQPAVSLTPSWNLQELVRKYPGTKMPPTETRTYYTNLWVFGSRFRTSRKKTGVCNSHQEAIKQIFLPIKVSTIIHVYMGWNWPRKKWKMSKMLPVVRSLQEGGNLSWYLYATPYAIKPIKYAPACVDSGCYTFYISPFQTLVVPMDGRKTDSPERKGEKCN